MSNQPASNPTQSKPSPQAGAGKPPAGAPGNKGDQDDRQGGQRSGAQSGNADKSPSNQRQAHSPDIAEDAVDSKGNPSDVMNKQGR